MYIMLRMAKGARGNRCHLPDMYDGQIKCLVLPVLMPLGSWCVQYRSWLADAEVFGEMLPLDWVERPRPRRFGKVFHEDVIACQQVSGKS